MAGGFFMITIITFKPDGTGLMESAPWYLMKDGSLRVSNSEAGQYPFYWGIVCDFTPDNAPVTLIKMVFEDQSYLFYI